MEWAYFGARGFGASLVDDLLEELAVLAAVDGVKGRADQLDVVLLEHTGLAQRHGGVQSGLAAQVGSSASGRSLAMMRSKDRRGDRLDVGGVGHLRVGHDGGRVGVDQDDANALFAQHAARLGAGIIELAGLADHDREPMTITDLMSVRFGHLRLLGLSSGDLGEIPASQAVLRGVDVQVVLLAVHESRKGGKEIVGIGGARRGLGVVLDREARGIEQLDALGGAVVEVHVRQANAAEALVHHDRRDSAAHPDAQVAVGRMFDLAAGKLGDKLAELGE